MNKGCWEGGYAKPPLRTAIAALDRRGEVRMLIHAVNKPFAQYSKNRVFAAYTELLLHQKTNCMRKFVKESMNLAISVS